MPPSIPYTIAPTAHLFERVCLVEKPCLLLSNSWQINIFQDVPAHGLKNLWLSLLSHLLYPHLSLSASPVYLHLSFLQVDSICAQVLCSVSRFHLHWPRGASSSQVLAHQASARWWLLPCHGTHPQQGPAGRPASNWMWDQGRVKCRRSWWRGRVCSCFFYDRFILNLMNLHISGRLFQGSHF